MEASGGTSDSRFSPSGVISYAQENTSTGIKPIANSAIKALLHIVGSSSAFTSTSATCNTSQDTTR